MPYPGYSFPLSLGESTFVITLGFQRSPSTYIKSPEGLFLSVYLCTQVIALTLQMPPDDRVTNTLVSVLDIK